MKQRTDSQGVPYSYLVDNIKVVLIFLVVFNHLIAFQLVKVDMVVRYVWVWDHHFSHACFYFYIRISFQEATGCTEECEESADPLYSWIQSDLVCVYLDRQKHGL